MRNRSHTVPLSVSLFLPVLALLFGACVENPFESPSEVQSPPRSIRGSVILSSGGEHDGAMIWLEGFSVSTRTDQSGAFQLSLPPPSAQGASGGANGAFTAWYYLANYRLRTTRVAVRNGYFVFPNDDFDEQGFARDPMLLQQLFSVATTLSKTRIRQRETTLMNVTVKMAASLSPVNVYYPRRVTGTEGPLIFHNLSNGEVKVLRSVVGGTEPYENVMVGLNGYERTYLVTIPRDTLSVGVYEIVPFILYRDQSVPVELLQSIGKNVETPSADYLRLPFRRSTARLHVDE